jgi:dTMP kinase
MLQSLIRVVLILALAAVPFAVAQVGRKTFHFGSVDYVVDGTRIVLIVGGILALFAGLLAYRKMDDRQQGAVWQDVTSAFRGDSSARRRMRTGGLFVAFEGGEGSGKSTQVERLAEWLRESGTAVTTTHEPGATDVGAQIRRLLLHDSPALSPRAEALLFAADRAHHVESVIRPALEAGQVVVTDRYVDSSLAYQGVGRNLQIDEVRKISRWATGGLQADLIVLLDLPAELGLARVRGRGGEDKLEAESISFHERVREAFRMLAESDPRRYLVLDASLQPDVIAAKVRAAVSRLIRPDCAPAPPPKAVAPQ